MKVSCFATLFVASRKMGSNSQRVLHEPDSRASSVCHFSEDLISVAEQVADAHSKPESAVEPREGFLADEAGLLTLNGAFVCKALLDLRQSCCQLHRHLIVLRDPLGVVKGYVQCCDGARLVATAVISRTNLAGAVGVAC